MSPFDQIVNKIVLRISLLASLVAYSTVMAEEKKAEVQITDVKSSQQILEYRVRLLGLPIGARSVIKINRSGKNLAVSNLIESPFVRNHHTSEFTMSRCDFMQLKYTNSGNVLSWKFNDNIEVDGNRKKFRDGGVEEARRAGGEQRVAAGRNRAHPDSQRTRGRADRRGPSNGHQYRHARGIAP